MSDVATVTACLLSLSIYRPDVDLRQAIGRLEEQATTGEALAEFWRLAGEPAATGWVGGC